MDYRIKLAGEYCTKCQTYSMPDFKETNDGLVRVCNGCGFKEIARISNSTEPFSEVTKMRIESEMPRQFRGRLFGDSKFRNAQSFGRSLSECEDWATKILAGLPDSCYVVIYEVKEEVIKLINKEDALQKKT